jgi:hypothetical protein
MKFILGISVVFFADLSLSPSELLYLFGGFVIGDGIFKNSPLEDLEPEFLSELVDPSSIGGLGGVPTSLGSAGVP